jgi:uncharacterized protein (TIGR03437 family)
MRSHLVLLFSLLPLSLPAQQPYPSLSMAAADAASSPAIYATSGSVLYRTVNTGQTWTTLYISDPGLDPFEVTAIATDPLDTAVVYAGTSVDRGGVWRSADSGATWTKASSGLVAPGSVDRIFVSETPRAVYARVGVFLFKSTDGLTWRKQSNLPGTQAIDILPKTPSVMAAADLNHVYRSLDEGATWQTAGSLLPAQWTDFTDIALDPRDNSVWATYSGATIEASGLFQCSNGACALAAVGGEDPVWVTFDAASNKVFVGLMGRLCTYLNGQTACSTGGYMGWKVRAARGKPGFLYAAAGKLFVSYDGGNTWRNIDGTYKPTLLKPVAEYRIEAPVGAGGVVLLPIKHVERATQATDFTVTLGGNSWMTASVTSGKTPTTAFVNIDRGLALGTYEGSIAIASPGTANGSVTIPVHLVVSASVKAPLYRIRTVAGSRQSKPAADGVPATESSLDWPGGIAVDSGGNLYIAEEDAHRVRKVNTAGVISTYAGQANQSGSSGDGGPAASAKLNRPHGLAVGKDGTLYIADTGNYKIRMVRPSGNISTYASSSGANPKQPTNGVSGMAFDRLGQLLVADTAQQRVWRFDTQNRAALIAGGGWTILDNAAATDSALTDPEDVAGDAAGNVYIVEETANRVRRLEVSNNTLTTVAGTASQGYEGDGGRATNASLNHPMGALVDAQGNLFIADGSNGLIRMVTPAGIIQTVAGTSENGAEEDGGPALGASLGWPCDLAADSAGRIHVADCFGRVLRMEPADGTAPVITAVTDAASGRPEVAAGGFATIWGHDFSTSNSSWDTHAQAMSAGGARLPVSYGGIAARVNNRECYIQWAGQGQINLLIPPGEYTSPATVEVLTGAGRASFTVPIASSSPAFFTNQVDGKANVAALFGNTAIYVARQNAWPGLQSRPAKAGDVLQLYANGLGPTTPAAPPGRVLTTVYPVSDLSKIKVTLGGANAEVLWAGLTYAGLYQVNVKVPAGVADGTQPAIITANGKSSPAGPVLAFTH